MNDTFHLTLDTAEILKNLSFKLQSEVFDILTDVLIDTFELTHVSYACDCQDLVQTKEYEIWKVNPFLFQKTDDKRVFNTDDYAFLLEASDQKVKIPNDYYYCGNRIRILGTVEDDSIYHIESMIPNRKQVITYYSYEILKPATVYGPLYYCGLKVLPDDTSELILRSHIVIK